MENSDLKRLMELSDCGYDVRIVGVSKNLKVYIGRTPVQRNEKERDAGIASMF